MGNSCSAGFITCWIVSQANILNNIAQNLQPVEKLLTGLCYVLGFIFGFKAIFSLKSLGESRTMMSSHGSVKEPFLYIITAAALLFFPETLSTLLQTSFGYSNVLAYSSVSSGSEGLDTLFGQGSVVGPALARILQIIGLIAFIRGWMLISRGGQQQAPGQGMGKGIVHIIGGVLAMNIVGTLQVISYTLYGTS